MSLNLGTIRSRVLDKLLETASNSHFVAATLNNFINEAAEFAAVFIVYPRSIYTVAAQQDVATYALPSDNLSIRTAYFGNTGIFGDIRALKVISEETLRELNPAWMDTTPTSQGRPLRLIIKDKNNFLINPRPDALNSASGKNIILNYNQVPAPMVLDSDVPSLPVPYHALIEFYVLHLCYTSLQNFDVAKAMEDSFLKKIKLIQYEVSKETKEGMAFQWGFEDGDNDDYSAGAFFIP